MAKAVLPYMRAQKGGKIINTSSIGGVIPLPFQGFYSASKAAMDMLFDSLRAEFIPTVFRFVRLNQAMRKQTSPRIGKRILWRKKALIRKPSIIAWQALPKMSKEALSLGRSLDAPSLFPKRSAFLTLAPLAQKTAS